MCDYSSEKKYAVICSLSWGANLYGGMIVLGDMTCGSTKWRSSHVLVLRLYSPFSGGPTFMPFPLTWWQPPHELAWYTMAPSTAKSGAICSASAFFGVSFSRNAASALSCESVSRMGGMELPGTIADGRLKCAIIQSAFLWISDPARSGPTFSLPSPTVWQLTQFSLRK